jgi:prepilin-type N-terminal cleavage/methylation domain-containing protein/prepilin-type processing-associated H-X9-DG protein
MMTVSIFTRDRSLETYRLMRSECIRRVSRKAFTLVELLVVISIIALLLAILMPSLRKARAQAQAVVCGLHMRQYGLAVVQYAADNDDKFAPYCNAIAYSRDAMFEPTVGMETSWINTLAPFMGGETVSATDSPAVKREKNNKNHTADFRRCPGKKSMIGVHYAPESKFDAPFYIESVNDPAMKHSSIRSAAGWITFMDTDAGWGMYSPNYHKFDYDHDGDGIDDSNRGAAMNVYWYNAASPKAHLDKSNIVLADGHVETMTFRVWQNPDNNPLWRQ